MGCSKVKSAFERYNPWTYFMYIAGNMTLAMILGHPLILVVGIVLLIAVHIISDRARTLYPFLKGYLFISLLTMVLNPLLNHRGATILFYLNDQCITLEATLYGVVMGCSIFLVLVTFSLYQYGISSDKLMYLFCKVVPTITMVLMLTLRMVPLLRERIEEISKIQKTQGVHLEQGKIKDRSKSAMENLNILVTWSLEEMMQTACSIRSRGYGLKKQRSFYFRYRIETRDTICMVIQAILLGSIIILWKGGMYTIYPRLQLHLFSARTMSILIIYSMYVSIPLWIEGWETYKWRLYK